VTVAFEESGGMTLFTPSILDALERVVAQRRST
jgi:hypothetical protein